MLGSPLGWIGRSAQYLGAVYILIAFITLDRSARHSGISISDMLSRFFGEAETSYKALVETATDAIVVFDPDDRIIVWNGAAEKMFGYGQSEAVGSSFIQLAIPDEFAGVIRCAVTGTADPGGDLTNRKPVEIMARRKDGSHFPVELALSRHIVAGTTVCTCIIRDLTERRQAEEERTRLLAEVGDKAAALEATISSIAIGLIVYDHSGKATRLNDAAKKVFQPELFFNKTVEERSHVIPWERENGEPFPLEEIPVARALRGETTYNVVIAAPFPSHKLWISASAAPIRTHDGRMLGAVASFVDITERELAEEALRESEERMRIALEAADLGTWSFDIVTGVAEHSLRHDQIFGYTEAVPEWSYEISIRHMLPEFHAVAREAVEQAMKTGRVSFEAQVRLPDGRIHWINPFGRVQYDSGGHAVRMSGVVSDITERRNAEDRIQNLLGKVRQERDRLSSLVNSISDEVWFADMQKNFTLANPAALREFALGSGEIDIEKFAASLEVYRPDGSPRPVDEAPPLRALEGEQVRNQEEMIRTPGPGVVRYRQVSANPVKDVSGTIIGSVSVVRDITERRKAESELAQKNEDLNVLNEELTATQEELHQHIGDLGRSGEILRQNEEKLRAALAEKEILLSEIHHRVKNNLTAFISLLSLEGSTEETPTGKQLKQDLQNRARSMALVHETLYRTHNFNDVDMEMYLTTLLEQIAQSFQMTKAVKTVVNAHGVMLDIPRATPAGLIINEIVTNSFKYAFPESFDAGTVRHAPPTISITLIKNDREYIMTVKDNGVGLPPGFEMAKTQTLGLKLVNFLARHQMRAKVDVHSDNGTEFIFRFKE